MRRNELTIGLVVASIALIVAFWLVALGPKRQEASGLKDDVDQLHSEVDQARQSAAAGEQARGSFKADYRQLVVLGKAVPQDADQASLLVQLQKLAERSGVEFEAIDLTDSANASAAATSTAAPAPSTSSGSASTTPTDGSTSTDATALASDQSAVATEASAATLPIGASIGPAGLPVMGYEMKFNGGFFQIADFLQSVDELVRTRGGAIAVNGRLLTVDGFTLSPILEEGSSNRVPTLTADLTVTSFVTPAAQGTTAGATQGGPAPAASEPAAPTPASGSTPSSAPPASSTPTSSTTP